LVGDGNTFAANLKNKQLMKKISTMFAIALCVISSHLFAQDKQDEIVAIWETPEAKVEIHQVKNRYIGNPINPEGEKNQEIDILNLEYKNGKWVGKIYSMKRDKTWPVVCEIKGDKLLLMINAGRVSRDLEWIKSNN
jgi:uncharacterized protein (DUF2147 family)